MNTITYTTGGGIAEASVAARNAAATAGGSANPTSATDGAPESASTAGEVELSSRAQKIRRLNEEFFPGGASTVEITPAFIQRLHEYGLISADDAERLGAESSSGEEEGGGTLGELSTFIDQFVDKLTEEDPDDGFIPTLENARSIIEHFDDTRQSGSTMPISTVSARISQYLASDQGQALGESETRSLERLRLALSIADRMSPANGASRQVNQYLALAGG